MRIPVLFLALLLFPCAVHAKDVGCDGSTMEMVECLTDKIDIADIELNKAYQALIAAARQIKADLEGELGSGKLEEEIRAAQRAWNDWRTKECVAESNFTFTGGSGRGPAHQACMLNLIKERTKYLKNLVQQ